MPSLIALLPNSARVMSSSAVVTVTFIIAVCVFLSFFLYHNNRMCLIMIATPARAKVHYILCMFFVYLLFKI